MPFPIMNAPTLHVFYDGGADCVIAASPADAHAVWCKTMGAENSDVEWEQCADDDTLTVWCGKENGEICEPYGDNAHEVTLTHREWVAREGRGFLCSTEY